MYSIDIPTDLEKLGELAADRFKPRNLFTTTDNANSLSLEEQLRRERMRLFTAGISSYEWALRNEDQQLILIPVGDKLFLFDEASPEADSMVYDSSIGTAIDPHISPDGNWVAYVINNDLYCQRVFPKSSELKPIRLTFDGSKEGISCGVADFLAQEEMDRYRGFWWSSDSSKIVLTVNDESNIPEFEILHQGKDDPRHAEKHRYPFAGELNPTVQLAVVTLPVDPEEYKNPPSLKWLDLGKVLDSRFQSPRVVDSIEKEYYVGRVGWWPDGSVMVQVFIAYSRLEF